jgi:tetratricopeptide (TPR) repeat protein
LCAVGASSIALTGARASALLAGGVALVLLSAASVKRNAAWRSDLSLWTDAATSQPGSATAHANLAYARFAVRDYAGAAQSLRAVLSIDPSSPEARVHLALMLCALHLPSDAVREASIVLEAHPRYAQAWAVRGNALEMLGRVDEARADLSAAIELEPENSTFRRSLAALGR